MRIEVLLQTEGQLAAVVGEAEGDTWQEMQTELPALLRDLAEAIEKRDEGEVPDAAPR
ncbi:hypothetical protein OHB41_20985 [Streptomyces sp. NBC_01571]|uniref:hypothetical protein n=1 Tax=Streptomyces sp. NBC_01571 TaxID=2975883 RepID=UPI002257A758|nr:hypothetical protein [Streptomyces sp. NBC_01571]MCX4575619.1 hypothetical protein [Streptomyces sp. NBC_01571]